jgi:hypothetical protein
VSPVDDFVKIVAAGPAFFVSAWLHASATYAKSPAPTISQDLAAATARPGTWRASIANGHQATPGSCGPPERRPATRPHDKPGDGEVHTASITAAR